MVDVDVVILGGGPWRSPLEVRTGWPLFALPCGIAGSLIECWMQVIRQGFESSALIRRGRAVLLLGDDGYSGYVDSSLGIEVVVESREHRGTAGALADLLSQVDCDSRLVLLVELSASPMIRLQSLFNVLFCAVGPPPACVVGASSLGRYCGVSLFSRSSLDLVPSVGFFDFKEQLIPAVRAAGQFVRDAVVARRARRIRDRVEWLDVVWEGLNAESEYDQGTSASSAVSVASGRRSLIASSSVVEESTILDSIVMAEAVVEYGAIVARSVIGPGMRVPAGVRIIDSMVVDPVIGREVLQRRKSGVVRRGAAG